MSSAKILISLAIVLSSVFGQQGDGLDHLRAAIPGEPGKDYPIFSISDLAKFGSNRNRARQPVQRQEGQQSPSQQQANTPVNPNRGRSGRNKENRRHFQTEIARGQIPGVPGRDYPTHSLNDLSRKFQGIQLAPDNLVTPDFPRDRRTGLPNQRGRKPASSNSINNNNGNNQPQEPVVRRGGNPNPDQEEPVLFSGNYCPGGALDHCINFCPRELYSECVAQCGRSCPE